MEYKVIKELRKINNVTTNEVERVSDCIHFALSKGDHGKMIERDGVKYQEALDPLELYEERVYTETDEPIESEVEE